MNGSVNRKPSYFFYIAIIAVAAVLTGFARTFIAPVSKGSFSAPAVVYIHGAFAFSWVLLFLIQASLIHLKKYHAHIILGSFGILVAVGTAATMLPVGKYAADKE